MSDGDVMRGRRRRRIQSSLLDGIAAAGGRSRIVSSERRSANREPRSGNNPDFWKYKEKWKYKWAYQFISCLPSLHCQQQRTAQVIFIYRIPQSFSEILDRLDQLPSGPFSSSFYTITSAFGTHTHRTCWVIYCRLISSESHRFLVVYQPETSKSTRNNNHTDPTTTVHTRSIHQDSSSHITLPTIRPEGKRRKQRGGGGLYVEVYKTHTRQMLLLLYTCH
jgi:hypothetical protein